MIHERHERHKSGQVGSILPSVQEAFSHLSSLSWTLLGRALDTRAGVFYFPSRMITVTDAAFSQLKTLVQAQPDVAKGLRISVENGGCAGLQYGMGLDYIKEGDEVVEREGLCVMIDPESAPHLRGVTIDYSDDLAGSGFRIKNPNAVRSCGCGTSFEPAESAHGSQH